MILKYTLVCKPEMHVENSDCSDKEVVFWKLEERFLLGKIINWV